MTLAARLAMTAGPLVLVLLAGSGAAHAQTPSCNDTTMFPNPIYLSGSSAFEPTAGRIAVKLAAQTVKYTLIYKATASCDGPAGIRDAVALTGNADYFTVDPVDPTKVAPARQCSLDATPTQADVGVADVSYRSCTGNSLPAGMADVSGPVQAMEIIVPHANTAITAISAQQAQNIWGCGSAGMISPFDSDAAIQQRNKDSGTQIMVSKYIGVPADMFKGFANGTGGNLTASLTGFPDKGIGILAADSYDTKRDMFNALAFQGFGQNKAYYADSTPVKFDKANVRDGHYMIFGPVHLFARTDTNGALSANAKRFTDWVAGASAIEEGKPLSYIDIEAGAGMIPQCAMKVRRDDDGALLKPYAPDVKCGCYFEHVVNKTDSVACVPCAFDTGCSGTKTCQNGYCE